MKRSKLDLEFGRHTILQEVVDHLKHAKIDLLILVTGAHRERIENLVGPSEPRIIKAYNPHFAKGMTTSIQCGINNAPENTQGFLVCLADMPFLKTEDYNVIIDAFLEKFIDKPLIIRPFVKGMPSNPVLFSHHFKHELLIESNMEGAKNVILKNNRHVHQVEFNEINLSKDIDTEADYTACRPS